MTLPGRGGGGKWAPGGGGDWNPESVGEGAFGKGEVIAAGLAGFALAGVRRAPLRAAGASFQPPGSRLGGGGSDADGVLVAPRAGGGGGMVAC